MSRLDRNIEGKQEASLDLVELLAAFAPGQVDEGLRRQAMACFLSGSAGWRNAGDALDGTFAAPPAEATGLRRGKE